MDVFDTPARMQAWSDRQRTSGRSIAFVPTMGALHAGHMALVDEARRHADLVVVSIFVNPLQFNVGSDFDAYPRPVDTDLEACRNSGVDAVYAPTASVMYPVGFQTRVEPGGLADRYEGAHRPGHFGGVTTVVAKLFQAVRPQVSVFGQKDAQQLAIVRRMVVDLDMGIEIVGLPTVREPDGVAMSSRNQRLDPADRAAAACIWQGLSTARAAFTAGERSTTALRQLAAAPIDAEPRARLEYVELVDPATFEPATAAVDDPLVVCAVWFGDVRLIDNLLLSSAPSPSRRASSPAH
ncbi:MAG: pantothenate synthetase [Actinomycetota bacterium]|jgi:pantoate--beta-alanine ligase